MFSFLSDLLRWFGQGLLTRPSSSTDGLSVPGRWRVTWRPRSAEGRLFVDHYLGGSLGSAVEAARRAGYRWTEQMSRKMSRNVEKRGVHAAGNAPSEDRKCWQGVELCIHGLRSWGRKLSRKVRETRSSGSQTTA